MATSMNYSVVARKNPSKKDYRKLCKTSESSYSSYQESSSRCINAVRMRINSQRINSQRVNS